MARRQILKDLIGLTGGNLSHHEGTAIMPAEYVGWSVVGANVREDVRGYLAITTGLYGHFDGFASPPLSTGDTSLSIDIQSCELENATSVASRYQCSTMTPQGLTIVSDIDDFLRVSEIWSLKRLLLNTFVYPFRPWMGMPEVYGAWNVDNVHFHYTTDAPEPSYSSYIHGVEMHYPAGTWDFRPLEFKTLRQTLQSRYDNIRRLLETFPERTFVLAGDSATGSVVSAYTALAEEFPRQVRCVLMRDVSALEPANWIVPSLKRLQRLDNYILFTTPGQLTSVGFAERVVRPLAAGLGGIGCGGLVVDTGTSSYGATSSWLRTLLSGFNIWVQCQMTRYRPSPLCGLDRRPGDLLRFTREASFDGLDACNARSSGDNGVGCHWVEEPEQQEL